MTPGWVPLAYAVGLCTAVAVLEEVLTGSGLKDWYPRLRKPRWQIRLWASRPGRSDRARYRRFRGLPNADGGPVGGGRGGRVAGAHRRDGADRPVALLFEYRSTIVGFLGPLLVLQTALFVYDPVAVWAHRVYTVYTLYVLAYDVPPLYAVWLRDLAPQPRALTPPEAHRPQSISCRPVILTRSTVGRAEISSSISCMARPGGMRSCRL